MEQPDNRQQSPQVNQSGESDNAPSLSKTETIKLLNESIDRLESTIKEIGKNSVKELPSSDSINSLLSTTQKLADSVTPPPPEVETTPTPQTQPNTTEEVTQEAAPKTPVQPNRDRAENRQQEPKEPITNNKKKEKQGLRIIGAIAIIIAIIALIWLFLPQINAKISSITQSTDIISDRPIPSQPQGSDLPNRQPNIEPETVETEPLQSSSDSQPLALESDIPLETSIPQDLKAPGRATNLKIKTIEPELTFTPEQTLVAALQVKLSEIANSYDSDLLEKAKVDFSHNALIVEITDDWYELNESRQTKLANEILKRSRQLNFNKLELQDATGTLVARNPVVGDRIIILQTEKTN